MISPVFDLEAGGCEHGPAFKGERGEWSDITRRAEPEHAGDSPFGERGEPIEYDIERSRAIGDRGHKLKGHGRTVLVDLSEEMHGEVQCFRACPADIRNPLTKLRLQPLRRCERRLGDGNGKEAPHPGGFAVAVGRGLGLAGDGLGVGHGLPPALVSDTWMSLAAQS